MARIALIKLFTGLNLAMAQLSGELRRAGHDSRIIHFKEHHLVNVSDIDQEDWCWTEHSGYVIAAGGTRKNLNCYRPFEATEFDLLVQELAQFGAQAIGISVVSGDIREAAYITAHIRQHLSVPIVWGGHGPTLEPERCIQYADLLCIHEGEGVIVELADRLDRSESLAGIPGTWYKDSAGAVHQYGKRPLLDLDALAMPNWRPEDNVYISGAQRQADYYPYNLNDNYIITTQRGCPFSCSFCIESKYQDEFGKKGSLRRRSVDQVLEELIWAKTHLPINRVLFYDDVFTVNPRWLQEFLPRYRDAVGLPFWCYTYPTTHNPEILSWLKDAGCDSITMGIQSGSPTVLREHFSRPTKLQRMIQAGQEIVDAGLSGEFDLIFRHPFETEEDLRQTFEFLFQFPQKMKSFWFAEMTYFPNHHFTKIAEEEARKNLLEIGSPYRVSEKIYAYYYRLYRLTRMKYQKERIRTWATDPQYRENPELLDAFLRYPEEKRNRKHNPSITY